MDMAKKKGRILFEWASLVAQWKRIHLPVQYMCVPSLVWEDPLENEMATHSSILAWEKYSCLGNPWTEEPDSLQSTGSQESDTTERLNYDHYHFSLVKRHWYGSWPSYKH